MLAHRPVRLAFSNISVSKLAICKDELLSIIVKHVNGFPPQYGNISTSPDSSLLRSFC